MLVVDAQLSADTETDDIVLTEDTPEAIEPNVYAPERNNSSVLGASAWSLGGYGFSQLLRLANNMALSYLLVPEAFGVMAMVNMVVIGLSMFSDVGAGPCIVQNARGDHFELLDTAWVVGVLRGFFITLVAAAVGPPIAAFYNIPSLSYLIPLSATTALINGFASTSIYTMQRHLDLKSLAKLDIQSQIIGCVCMCSFCLISPTVTSLVFGTIATALARTLLSHRSIKNYHNHFRFNRSEAIALFSFGKWIFISTLFMFAALQVDRMVMGKLFDVQTIGIYSFGLAIAMIPRIMVEKLSTSILYPMLSRSSRESPTAFSEQLSKARGVILAVGAAMVISVFCWCQEFFTAFYHDDYSDAGEICQWLCVSVWVSMLTITLVQALVAMRHTREMARSNMVKLPSAILASLLGFRFAGLDGFIIGLAIGELAGTMVVVFALSRRGVRLIQQDILKTSMVFATMLFIAVCQQNASNLPTRIIVMLIVTALFWASAIVKVRRFRREEYSQDTGNELATEPF